MWLSSLVINTVPKCKSKVKISITFIQPLSVPDHLLFTFPLSTTVDKTWRCLCEKRVPWKCGFCILNYLVNITLASAHFLHVYIL